MLPSGRCKGRGGKVGVSVASAISILVVNLIDIRSQQLAGWRIQLFLLQARLRHLCSHNKVYPGTGYRRDGYCHPHLCSRKLWL